MQPKRTTPQRPANATCDHCGRPYFRLASRLAKSMGHFCSKDCQYAARRQTAICRTCGAVITLSVSAFRYGRGKWCSHDCYLADPSRSLAGRFWAKARKSADPDGCWAWTAARNPLGYGEFRAKTDRRAGMDLAHRVAYELTYGPIPLGMQVCHRCDNPSCVRPDHLFLGSNADNVADRQAKGRSGSARGAQNPNAKLDIERVAEIRRRHAAGETTVALGAEFGVTATLIGLIARRKVWRHV
jgi:hypothetical protein